MPTVVVTEVPFVILFIPMFSDVSAPGNIKKTKLTEQGKLDYVNV